MPTPNPGEAWTSGTDDQTAAVQADRAAADTQPVTLDAGDLQIGAVEIKDATTSTRSIVTTSTPASTDAGLVVREALNPGTPSQAADVTVDGTAGGVTVLAANANRKSAVIQNVGSANMRVSVGGTPTATTGIQLAAGQTLSLRRPHCPTGAIKAIRESSTSTTASVLEIS